LQGADQPGRQSGLRQLWLEMSHQGSARVVR
jgi:hypothetical protein